MIPRDPALSGRAPGIKIERATADDSALVAELVREGFRSEAERYGVDIPPMLETSDDVLTELENGDITLIARIDGHAVGTVRGHTQPDGSVLVRRLAVLPQARRLGVARGLMDALESAYPASPRFELFTGIDTLPAIALYESLGYVRTRNEEQMPGVTIAYLEKRRR
jgi:ribosomal protein S18 acetylase RimI-like enzyme